MAAHIADTPWTSVVTWAMDINADPSCRMTTDPDVVLGGSTGPEITMALGGRAGHSDQCGPWWLNGMAHRYPHCFMQQHRTWSPTRPLLVTWTIDINTEHGCSRASDPNVDLSCNMTATSPWPPTQDRLFSSIWLLAAVRPVVIDMASGYSTDYRQTSAWLLVDSCTIDINPAPSRAQLVRVRWSQVCLALHNCWLFRCVRMPRAGAP